MLASSFSTRFLLRKNRRSRSLPPLGATCSLPHFRFAQMWPRIFPRGLPGYVPLFPGLPRARTPALAPIRSHFAPRNRAAGHRPHRGRCFAVPVTAPPRRAPNGKTPALAPIRSHFAPRNRAGRSSAPPGPMFWPAPLSLCSSAVPRPKPRRLLPFGRISPAAKPRGRSLPPPGATCSLPHFRSAKSRWPVIGPTGADVLPSPSRLRRAGSPTAKPRRLLPFGRISPAAKPRGRSLPPLGATCSLPHFRSAQMWPHARTPALAPVRSHFAPRNRAAGHRPHRGRCFAVPVTAPPRRVPNGKTPALLVFNPVFSAQKPAGASPRFRTAGR